MRLTENRRIGNSYFLTGGTALSVFYLHHRKSNDLDLFSLSDDNLAETSFLISRTLDDVTIVRESTGFVSMLVSGTKVDLVHDRLSFKEKRPIFEFENGNALIVDTLRSISSNKLCACVSRTEPKDLVDLFYIKKFLPEISLTAVLRDARKKEALLDDPPTAAFQLEENLSFFLSNPSTWPVMKIPFDIDELTMFFRDLAKWLYSKVKV